MTPRRVVVVVEVGLARRPQPPQSRDAMAATRLDHDTAASLLHAAHASVRKTRFCSATSLFHRITTHSQPGSQDRAQQLTRHVEKPLQYCTATRHGQQDRTSKRKVYAQKQRVATQPKHWRAHSDTAHQRP